MIFFFQDGVQAVSSDFAKMGHFRVVRN